MKMCIIATRGSHTALINVFTTVMAAAISEMSVRVLLRDEAVFRLLKDKVSEVTLPALYEQEKDQFMTRLTAMQLIDLQALIRDAKKQGDVQVFACSSSLAICGRQEEDLIGEIDGIRGVTSFLLDEVSEADVVLSF